MSRVEGDRINADDAREVFERLLPYAMALGIAGAWAHKFEGIYQARSGPTWYVGNHGSHFSTRSFEQSISSAMTQIGSAMASSPRSSGSSGFGGGGFSGGGGGGGSW